MTKKKKNKSVRSTVEFPNLDNRFTLRSRRVYMDNKKYVSGVKHKGKSVMPPLSTSEKRWLDTFNKEYYAASFDSPWEYDGIHKIKVDKDTVLNIKDQIKVIKKARLKIYNKSPNTTTDSDRELAEYFSEQIEDMEQFIYKVHPRREIDDANNARNRDILNHERIVSIHDLDDNELLIDDGNPIMDMIICKDEEY